MRFKVTLILGLLILSSLCVFISKGSYASEENEMKPSTNYLIILVHGIAGDYTAFEGNDNLKSYLERSLGLDGYVYSYSFNKANNSNDEHAEELGNRSNSDCWLRQAQDDFHARFPARPIPNKYVLIAHSMGGLAARAYITSNFYQDDVKKLVTLDTPHLGADVIDYLNRYYGLENFAKECFSKEIDDYLKNQIVENVKKQIKDRFTEKVGSDVAKNGLSNVISRYLFNVPKWPNDIYSNSCEQLLVLEQLNPSAKEYYYQGRIIPGWTGTIAQLFSYLVFAGKGYDEMTPGSGFLSDLKHAKATLSTKPISYRLVSVRGTPTPSKDYIYNYRMSTPYVSLLMIPYTNEWRKLDYESEKYWSITMSMLFPGSWQVKDGSLLVALDSSRGEGVDLFNKNTKRYEYFFKSDHFESDIHGIENLYYTLLAFHALNGFCTGLNGIYLLPTWALSIYGYGILATELANPDQNSGVLRSHEMIPKAVCKSDGVPIIELALFDEPITTVTSLETDLDIAKYNTSQDRVHTDNITTVKMENFDQATSAPTLYQSQAVPITTSRTTEVYLTYITVKTPVTQIKGVLNDFKPLMMKSFEISENFAAWQDLMKPDQVIDKSDTHYKCKKGKYTFEMDNWGDYLGVRE